MSTIVITIYFQLLPFAMTVIVLMFLIIIVIIVVVIVVVIMIILSAYSLLPGSSTSSSLSILTAEQTQAMITIIIVILLSSHNESALPLPRRPWKTGNCSYSHTRACQKPWTEIAGAKPTLDKGWGTGSCKRWPHELRAASPCTIVMGPWVIKCTGMI